MDVKARLKLFEANPSQKTDQMDFRKEKLGLNGQPGHFSKNVSSGLQKHLQKQSEDLGDKPSSNSHPTVGKKPALPVGNKPVATKINEQDKSASKPDKTVNTSTNSTSSLSSRKVSVPKVFQTNSAVSDSPPSTTAGIKPGIQSKPTPAAAKLGTNLRPTTPPKPVPGAPKSTSNVSGGSPASVSPSNKPDSATTGDRKGKAALPSSATADRVKLPGLDKIPAKPIDSLSPTKSPLLSSSPSSPTSVQSSSSSNADESNEKGIVDFRSRLRKTNSSFSTPNGAPTKYSSAQETKEPPLVNGHLESTPAKLALKPVTTPQNEKMATSPSSPPALPQKPAGQELKRQSSGVIIERQSDNKKFKKVKLESVKSPEQVPTKPQVPSDIDLSKIKQAFQKAIQEMKEESDAVNQDAEEDDEIYQDGYSANDVLPRRSTFKRKSDRVSIIPEMAPEDEGLVYDEGCTPATEELYIDAESEKKTEDDDDGDLYEDEMSLVINKKEESEEEKRKRQKEEAEAKKREEKEKRDKQKEEERRKKKEEKEKEREKEREQKMRKKLKLKGDEVKLGEGVVKQDATGKGLNLSVKRGQMVTILRLNDNPVNMWLVKTDSSIGYLESANIEVDPGIIKTSMNEARKMSVKDDGVEDQPLYDDVPHDEAVPELEEEDEDDAIYAECP